MKQALVFITRALFSGILIIVPIYLATLLLLKGVNSVLGLVRPLARLLPNWIPAETALAVLLVLLICFVVGVAVRTAAGLAFYERIEKSFFERIPGYALTRSLTQRMAGKSHGNVWRPALFENSNALVMAFIIEEFADGRYTVFVPSIPAPFSGAVYIVTPNRVHPLDVPFTEAIKSVSRWGAGARELVAAMEMREAAMNPGADRGARGDAIAREA